MVLEREMFRREHKTSQIEDVDKAILPEKSWRRNQGGPEQELRLRQTWRRRSRSPSKGSRRIPGALKGICQGAEKQSSTPDKLPVEINHA